MKNNTYKNIVIVGAAAISIATISILSAFLALRLSGHQIYDKEDSGRWERAQAGIIVDNFTGAQWTERDNLTGIDWENAQLYCKNLSLAGGKWSIPTDVQLLQLFTGGRDGNTPCGNDKCMVSPKFYLTGPGFWSTKTEGNTSKSGAWYIFLGDGRGYPGELSDNSYMRSLCIRLDS